MIEMTSTEKVLYRAQFEFWYTIAGLDCAAANARAYEKILAKRSIAKSLEKQGLTQ